MVDKRDLNLQLCSDDPIFVGGVPIYPIPISEIAKIRIQEKLESEIQELRKAQDEHTCRLLQMEENSQRRERNKLRDRLLQNYRYYTSKEHNPRQEWTRMESETFWECFADYENMNGNGYMHSVVQPEMNLLGIIEMDDTSGIAELMHSRK